MIEVDEKLQLAQEVWNKMSENAKEEVRRYIESGRTDYYQGSFDSLSQVQKAFGTSVEQGQKVCSQLIVLAYLVLNSDDLNLMEKRKYVN